MKSREKPTFFATAVLVTSIIFTCSFNTLFAQSSASLEKELPALSDSQVFSFTVGKGSSNSETYVVTATEENAFAYYDADVEQFVIEINGDNDIGAMLIIEKPVEGKHTFSMEMQIVIEGSTNDGEDYFIFDNYQENGGGYIQIDRIDDIGGTVSGSFSGQFGDSETEEDIPVLLEGRFSVKHVGNDY